MDGWHRESVVFLYETAAQEFLRAVVDRALELGPRKFKSSKRKQEHQAHAALSFRLLQLQLVELKAYTRKFAVRFVEHQLLEWEQLSLLVALGEHGGKVVSHLQLKGCGVTAAALGELARALAAGRLAALQTLDLSYNDLGAAGLRTLLEALREHTALEQLLLAGTRAGDDGAALVCEFLALNRSLKVVDLADCGIGAAGFEHIHQLVLAHTHISDLRLKENEGIDNDHTKLLGVLLKRNEAVHHVLQVILNQALLQIRANQSLAAMGLDPTAAAAPSAPSSSSSSSSSTSTSTTSTSTSSLPLALDMDEPPPPTRGRQRGGTIDVSLIRSKARLSFIQ